MTVSELIPAPMLHRPPDGSDLPPDVTSPPAAPGVFPFDNRQSEARVQTVAGADIFAEDLAGQITALRGYAVWLSGSGSLADDLIQDTLVRAWIARDRFEPGTNLRRWCITILRNVFFSYKRQSWRARPLSGKLMDELASETSGADDRLDLLAVRNAMALLPQDQREALLVTGVGGQNFVEAARLCACAVGTMKSRVYRGRARLAAIMSANEAGFSSDPGLGAAEALSDLLSQAARITSALSDEAGERVAVQLGADAAAAAVFRVLAVQPDSLPDQCARPPDHPEHSGVSHGTCITCIRSVVGSSPDTGPS